MFSGTIKTDKKTI